MEEDTTNQTGFRCTSGTSCRTEVDDTHESCSTRETRSSASRACDSVVDSARDGCGAAPMTAPINILAIAIEQD